MVTYNNKWADGPMQVVCSVRQERINSHTETKSGDDKSPYKDIEEVIRESDALDIGTRVARARPVANIKR
jgi:RNA-splicing ligase RtcB